MKKVTGIVKYRVDVINIRNGNKAPYFVVEGTPSQKRDEIEKMAQEEFKNKSSLAKFSNWRVELEKL